MRGARQLVDESEVQPQRKLNLTASVVRSGAGLSSRIVRLNTVARIRIVPSLVVEEVEYIHIESEAGPLRNGKDLEE